MQQASDSKLMFIKFARIITYLIYAYFVIATAFLIVGFFLLLFGANPGAAFTKFIYHFAAVFLQPFREIFPGHSVSDRSYFSSAALFAIIIYGLGAMALHAFITYISLKQARHQQELSMIEHKNSARSYGAEAGEDEASEPPEKVVSGRPPRVSM